MAAAHTPNDAEGFYLNATMKQLWGVRDEGTRQSNPQAWPEPGDRVLCDCGRGQRSGMDACRSRTVLVGGISGQRSATLLEVPGRQDLSVLRLSGGGVQRVCRGRVKGQVFLAADSQSLPL